MLLFFFFQYRYYTDQHEMRRTRALGEAMARQQHRGGGYGGYGGYGGGAMAGRNAGFGDHYSRLGDAHDMVGATYLGDRSWIGAGGRGGIRYPNTGHYPGGEHADPRF